LTIPQFPELIRGKSILDYGCGPGWQTVAMNTECGAKSVLGIDIDDGWLTKARSLAESEGCTANVRFSDQAWPDLLGSFDIGISLCAFEHFADPTGVLDAMRSMVKPDGLVIISFAEPWLSPHGSHMNDFTKIPWVNALFPETTVMRFRAWFRDDGATRYEDVRGGLNRMTLAKFENIIRGTGMETAFLKYRTVKGLPLVATIPLVREFLVAAVTCILRNRSLQTKEFFSRDRTKDRIR
jgi:SAM-dependent methyltransferase